MLLIKMLLERFTLSASCFRTEVDVSSSTIPVSWYRLGVKCHLPQICLLKCFSSCHWNGYFKSKWSRARIFDICHSSKVAILSEWGVIFPASPSIKHFAWQILAEPYRASSCRSCKHALQLEASYDERTGQSKSFKLKNLGASRVNL